ncbi:MAG: C45 family peptidase [Candidatus Korarchaeota archaeon]
MISRFIRHLDFVEISGNHYEMGKDIGHLYKNVIDQAIKVLYSSQSVQRSKPAVVPIFLLRAYIRIIAINLRKKIEKKFPEMHEYMRGLSEGAELDILTLYEINLFESLSGDIKFEMALPGGCTGYCSANLIGKNYDFPLEFEPFQFVRLSRPKGKHAVLACTHHPIPGTHDGINDAGLTILYTYKYCLDYDLEGIPNTILIQYALENFDNADDAVEFFKKAERATGASFLIADGKNAYVLETSGKKYSLRTGDKMATANIYVSQEMKSVEIPRDTHFKLKGLTHIRVLESSEKRLKRMEEMLNGINTVEDLIKAFSDHGPEEIGSDNTICRHADFWKTLSTQIFVPSEKKLVVCSGNPCASVFDEFCIR